MEELRYFSGKYDSVKQKATLKSIDGAEDKAWESLYLYYTAILRMEMLFTGKIVIPDAFWYDGAYFASMVKNKVEFTGFQEFLKVYPLVEVRRRPKYVRSMFAKPFEFSSLIQNPSMEGSFAQSVYQFGSNLGKALKDNMEEISMADYTKRLVSYIRAENSAYLDQCKEFIERLNGLDRALGVQFCEWENLNAVPEVFDMPSIYDETSHSESNRNVLIELMNTCASDYPELKELSAMFSREMGSKGKFPNRSCIIDVIRKIKDTVLSDDRRFQDVYERFNLVYHMGMAKQHRCDLLDLMDDKNASKRILDQGKQIEREKAIPKDLLVNIAGCPWSEFHKVFSKNDFLTTRYNWLNSLRTARNSQTTDNINHAEGALLRFADHIIKAFPNLQNAVYNASLFYDRQNGDLYVSCGSNEYDILGNDVCIAISNSDNNSRIVRVRSTVNKNLADQVLDTLIYSPNHFIRY